jgi:hypothetical protein
MSLCEIICVTWLLLEVGLAPCIVSEPVIVEVMVALNAAEFSGDLGLQSIILKGDSLQIVNALKTNG